MVEGQKPIVTITGISGFIGSQVCLDFLKSGEYQVRGTVRDSKNEAKISPLRKAFGEYFDKLELVNADLLNTESVTKAIAGSTYVVHTASPFFFPENDEDVIKPAVDGTVAVMHACSASGGVKRCVITSSIAAIASPAKAD
jgi:nucleoside-diphosphate-sugar epimerase